MVGWVSGPRLPELLSLRPRPSLRSGAMTRCSEKLAIVVARELRDRSRAKHAQSPEASGGQTTHSERAGDTGHPSDP